MRPIILRAARYRALTGALLISTGSAAVAQAAGPGGPSAPPTARASTAPIPHSLRVGEPLDVQATVSPSLAGHPAELEQQVGGGWRPLTQAPVDGAGRVHLRTPAQRSGLIRVAVTDGSTGRYLAATSPATVSVHALLQLGARRLSVGEGQVAFVRGRLEPAGAGRRVLLQGAAGRGWHTLARSSTDGAGRYRLTTVPHSAGYQALRVVFPGDGGNGAAVRGLRPLEVFRPVSVSTYGGSDGLDGSPLACGGTLSSSTLGVANLSLPCGTRVTLRYHGHEVRVPVVDRGPYVGGREYDLTSATAGRLGFSGTGDILTTR